MNLELVKCFLTLVHYRNFSVAAEELFMSQSTLSKKIKTLELELGTTLFNRTTRQIELTEAGLAFQSHAKRLMDTYLEMNMAMETYSTHSLVLKVGAIPVINQYGIANVLANFAQEHPAITLELIEKEHVALNHALQLGMIDVAFMRLENLDSSYYESIPLVADELVLITPISFNHDKSKKVQLAQIHEETFILLPKHSGVYQTCMKAFEKASISPNSIQTQPKIETILSLVQAGFGVSLLMKQSLACFNHTGIQVVELEPQIKSELGLVWLKNKKLNHKIKWFNEVVEAAFNKTGELK
ncbi:MAG: LysR family transcriptional regulator [Turicibacter sp.]